MGSSYECDPTTSGQCQCKENVINRECNECKDEFYDLNINNTAGQANFKSTYNCFKF